MLMMLAWPGWLLKGPRADAHDAGLAGVLLKGPRAAAHDAGLAGVAAESATGYPPLRAPPLARRNNAHDAGPRRCIGTRKSKFSGS